MSGKIPCLPEYSDPEYKMIFFHNIQFLGEYLYRVYLTLVHDYGKASHFWDDEIEKILLLEPKINLCEKWEKRLLDVTKYMMRHVWTGRRAVTRVCIADAAFGIQL